MQKEKDKYHLRVGDLLHNSKSTALGLVTKTTRHYFYFYLMSRSTEDNPEFMVTEDKASKQKVYESIDSGLLEVYYGTKKRRKRRKTFYQDFRIECEDFQTC